MCIFNSFAPFSREVICSVINVLEDENIQYRLTILDARGELSDTSKVDLILNSFPGIHIIIPDEKSGVLGALNIFSYESKARYNLFISTDLMLTSFSVKHINAGCIPDKLLGIVPEVTKNNVTLNSSYSAYVKKKQMLISVNSYNVTSATMIPYKFSGLFSPKKIQLLGGIDEGYTNPFIAGLDFGYRGAALGARIMCSEGFSCEEIESRAWLNSTGESRATTAFTYSFHTGNLDIKYMYLKNVASSYNFFAVIGLFFSFLSRRQFRRAFNTLLIKKEWSLLNERRIHQNEEILIEN